MRSPRARRRLSDSYRFPGVRPLQTVIGIFGEPGVRIVTLVRGSKKRHVECAAVFTAASTIEGCTGFRDLPCGGMRIFVELELRRVACRSRGAVKRERLDFLADNSRYSKRFAFYGCRSSAIKDIAEELHLEWHTVKELEKQYMREQLRRAGTPGPKVIGIDEVSIRKGHTYRIVVSDLIRRRPIWFGGADRSEASMDEFFTWLAAKKNPWIRLAVMDMWKPFRTSTTTHAPQASILFDKFHVLRHLGDALDGEEERVCATGGQGPPLHQG
jgi:transposase